MFEVTVQDPGTGKSYSYLVKTFDQGYAWVVAKDMLKDGWRIVSVIEAVDASA